MSSTSKARLQTIKDSLDTAFANAHTDDRLEMVKDLREYLSRQASAAKRPGYDDNHSNAATSSL
jgi:hypothetical protein